MHHSQGGRYESVKPPETGTTGSGQETGQHRHQTDPCSPTAVTLTKQTRMPAYEPTVNRSICVFSHRKETSRHKRIHKDSHQLLQEKTDPTHKDYTKPPTKTTPNTGDIPNLTKASQEVPQTTLSGRHNATFLFISCNLLVHSQNV